MVQANAHDASLIRLAPAITGKFAVALVLLSYCEVWGSQQPATPSRPFDQPAQPNGGRGRAAFLGWGFVMGLVFWRFDGTHYPCFLLLG